MSITAAASAERTIALELIDCPANVRELDLAHVDALAGSIALRGLIVPLVVRPAGEGRYTLVAGFHRHAACQRSVVDQVPVVVRDEDGESADRAAENVVRKALTPLEEARAVKAMSTTATRSTVPPRCSAGRASGCPPGRSCSSCPSGRSSSSAPARCLSAASTRSSRSPPCRRSCASSSPTRSPTPSSGAASSAARSRTTRATSSSRRSAGSSAAAADSGPPT